MSKERKMSIEDILGFLLGIIFGICFSFCLGVIKGWDTFTGESRVIDTGTYNVVQIMGDSSEDGMSGKEMLVSDLDDSTDHHFVVVSEKCFDSHTDGADLLTVVSDDNCIWSRKSAPATP